MKLSSLLLTAASAAFSSAAAVLNLRDDLHNLEARQNNNNFITQYWKNDFSEVDWNSGSGGKFNLSWDNGFAGNFVIGKGYRPSRDMLFNYSGSFDIEGSGFAYLTLYGWTRNPLVEWYVIESMGAHNPSDNASATLYGHVESDGAVYEIWQKERINAPSIDGDKTNFQQYWSIRTSMHVGGTINTGNHWRAWEEVGLKLGTHQYMALAVEGQKGRGKADLTAGVLPSTKVVEKPTPTERTEWRSSTTRRVSSTSSTRAATTTTSSTRRSSSTARPSSTRKTSSTKRTSSTAGGKPTTIPNSDPPFDEGNLPPTIPSHDKREEEEFCKRQYPPLNHGKPGHPPKPTKPGYPPKPTKTGKPGPIEPEPTPEPIPEPEEPTPEPHPEPEEPEPTPEPTPQPTPEPEEPEEPWEPEPTPEPTPEPEEPGEPEEPWEPEPEPEPSQPTKIPPSDPSTTTRLPPLIPTGDKTSSTFKLPPLIPTADPPFNPTRLPPTIPTAKVRRGDEEEVKREEEEILKMKREVEEIKREDNNDDDWFWPPRPGRPGRPDRPDRPDRPEREGRQERRDWDDGEFPERGGRATERETGRATGRPVFEWD